MVVLEITSNSITISHLILDNLTIFTLSELLTTIPPSIQLVDRSTSFSFPFIPRINVSLKMIPDVITDVHFVQMTKLGQFTITVQSRKRDALQLSAISKRIWHQLPRTLNAHM
jgi:hypothetical protein